MGEGTREGKTLTIAISGAGASVGGNTRLGKSLYKVLDNEVFALANAPPHGQLHPGPRSNNWRWGGQRTENVERENTGALGYIEREGSVEFVISCGVED